MGINSTEVNYSFGQMGSMLVDATTNPFYPPKGLAIVAITAIDSTTFAASGGLVSELNTDNPGSVSVGNYLTTEGAGGHVDGEITDADPHSAGLGSHPSVFTDANILTAGVKVGMYVHTTGTMLPYSLTNPFIVKAINSSGLMFTLTDKNSVGSNPANAANVNVSAAKADGSNEPCYFYSDHGQGVGGYEMDASNTIPTGVTIYGRWTSGQLAGGAIIAYFG